MRKISTVNTRCLQSNVASLATACPLAACVVYRASQHAVAVNMLWKVSECTFLPNHCVYLALHKDMCLTSEWLILSCQIHCELMAYRTEHTAWTY